METRVEDTVQGSASVELRRDEEFWLDDGTVILVARGVGFRVYRGVLSMHSSVFSHMFSLSQPDDLLSAGLSPELKCPVVHLDDSPEDLRHILRAFLPGKGQRFVHGQLEYPTYDMISAYARLGHKYQIDHLLGQALQYLQDHFTDDFGRWFTSTHETGFVPPCWKPILVHCLGAKPAFMQKITSAVLHAFTQVKSMGCNNWTRCQPRLQDLLHGSLAADETPIASPYPFHPLSFYTNHHNPSTINLSAFIVFSQW
ncbi:hypothetical protein L226DRAFT_532808 [Lentinus tigrinus ALCF2SS1-7]|uniref:BTB domain-containing protein n=1 Tax=Lentinus tigrinus ALCF2SS1-6 TaxID=1328759 RepID=A0A5C2RPV5_9APHY|nr:hypothetical protein L227DRAFT_384332 [Lentinus tigrinus ALCF2SS1-6]RPD76781.1 hypothetical protein L226DRAFT_532808 [Lentinus tigrinus ALCF2SS1-7]